MDVIPFTLCETEEYLKSRHIEWSRYDIVECYMTMGGIPFYLSQLDEDLTYSANIDNLFFRQKGALWDEFRHLYRTLFRNSDIYVRVVEALSNKKSGMTRGEISAATKLPNNGDLTRVLQNLVDSDFVRQYHFFGNKRKNMLYQLCDNYTLFYYRFIKDNYGRDERYWTNTLDSPARKAWAGNAFELVCKSHIQQIKRKLGILGVLSQDSVCTIDRDYEMQLRNKIEAFRSCTKSRSALYLTMITTYGVQRNAHSGIMQSEVTMDDTKVRYPVDVELVHDGCKAIDGIISKVCASLGISVIKTCYKDARRFYLELVKLKKKGGKPLGRPPKNPPSPEILAKMAKAVGERNEVECSFGTGKRIYRANNIRAKLPETARCWTGMCYFVKNVMKFLRELCHALIEIWHMLLAQVTCGGNVCYPMVLAKY